MDKHQKPEKPAALISAIFPVLLISLIWILGCSPKGSYKVLSIFFDGVNDSTEMETRSTSQSRFRSDSLNMSSQTADHVTGFTYHRPYFNQECSQCHDKSARSRLIKPIPDLCYTCHTDFKTTYKVVHGPVSGGYCLSCHDHHMSDNAMLLKTKGQKMCTPCHSQEDLLQNTQHTSMGQQECTVCHNPHGGETRSFLKQ